MEKCSKARKSGRVTGTSVSKFPCDRLNSLAYHLISCAIKATPMLLEDTEVLPQLLSANKMT